MGKLLDQASEEMQAEKYDGFKPKPVAGYSKERLQWLWPDMIARGIFHVFAGDSGIGRSGEGSLRKPRWQWFQGGLGTLPQLALVTKNNQILVFLGIPTFLSFQKNRPILCLHSCCCQTGYGQMSHSGVKCS